MPGRPGLGEWEERPGLLLGDYGDVGMHLGWQAWTTREDCKKNCMVSKRLSPSNRIDIPIRPTGRFVV